MSLEELILVINNNYDPEETSIIIDRFSFRRKSSFVDMDIQLDVGDDARFEQWRLRISGYRASKLINNSFSEILLFKEHPLLWMYNDLQVSLYFEGAIKDPYKFNWTLNQVHQSILNDFIPVNTFVNTELNINNINEPQYGLLARGPKKLMLAYSECLKQEQLNYSFVGEVEPKLWNGERFAHGFQNPKVLVLENSYVIADDFFLEKRDANEAKFE